MYVTFKCFIAFVCLFVYLSRRGGAGGRAGRWGAGSSPERRQSAGARFSREPEPGRNHSHPRLLIAPARAGPCAAEIPVPAPAPPPATAHPPPPPREEAGRPRRRLRPGSPRMPSAASILLPLPPPPARPRALPRRAPPPPPRVSFYPLPKSPGLLWARGFLCCLPWVYFWERWRFSAGAPEGVKSSRVNPSLKRLQTETGSHLLLTNPLPKLRCHINPEKNRDRATLTQSQDLRCCQEMRRHLPAAVELQRPSTTAPAPFVLCAPGLCVHAQFLKLLIFCKAKIAGYSPLT